MRKRKLSVWIAVGILLLLSGCSQPEEELSGIPVHFTQKPTGNVFSSESTASGTDSKETAPNVYYANTKSKKFHRPDCATAKRISDENLLIADTREELLEEGYSPCGSCHP